MISHECANVNKKCGFSQTGNKRMKYENGLAYIWRGKTYTIFMKDRTSTRENLFWWCAGGVVVTAILGTVLHFLYEWTGESAVTKPFSAIDESTWQHMKIMYFPMFIFGIMQWCFLRHERSNFWLVKLVGLLVALALIPALFYTYNGAFGTSPDWLNITIFMLSAIGGSHPAPPDNPKE